MRTDPTIVEGQQSLVVLVIYFPSMRQLQLACQGNDKQLELQLAISFHKERLWDQVGHIIRGEQVKSTCHRGDKGDVVCLAGCVCARRE